MTCVGPVWFAPEQALPNCFKHLANFDRYTSFAYALVENMENKPDKTHKQNLIRGHCTNRDCAVKPTLPLINNFIIQGIPDV